MPEDKGIVVNQTTIVSMVNKLGEISGRLETMAQYQTEQFQNQQVELRELREQVERLRDNSASKGAVEKLEVKHTKLEERVRKNEHTLSSRQWLTTIGVSTATALVVAAVKSQMGN